MNSHTLPTREPGGIAPPLLVAVVAFIALLAGCASPVGAYRVRTHQAYEQVEANALHSRQPSAETVSILHRHGLAALADRHPDQAVRQLHERAVASGERALLFALAELSYSAGQHIRQSVQPWDARDARDYFLGSAVYAWLYLFGEGADAPPGPFDRRFRVACDFYNYSLGLALTDRWGTNAAVQLQGARRRLPVGAIEVRLADGEVVSRLAGFEQVLLADQFQVRGLSVRNREPGLGVPLIAVQPLNREFGIRQSAAMTAFLRGPASLAELAGGQSVCALELHSIFDGADVTVGATRVPLEKDLTTYRAYTMNQSTIWKLGPLQFLAPAERIRSRLIPYQPYDPDRIPVVFVHGTFSSPVTWAEMANTLTADPVLRKRYQIWTFIYGSGNPLAQSVAEFRAALKAEVQRLDPSGTNAALRQMVIIGHSQGGLLTKSAVVDTGDRLWRVFSTNRLEDLKITDEERARLRSFVYYEPLPFVRRVVFIATPHRGSYLSGGFARRLARRLVSLPGAMVARGTDLLSVAKGSEAGAFFRGRLPTSLDGMSPKNPGLLVMAELPVQPPVAAHSIIAIKGDGEPGEGGDGVVRYSSAHVDYVQSEYIVRGSHGCLSRPATIEEVRRILREHLAAAGAEVNPAPR